MPRRPLWWSIWSPPGRGLQLSPSSSPHQLRKRYQLPMQLSLRIPMTVTTPKVEVTPPKKKMKNTGHQFGHKGHQTMDWLLTLAYGSTSNIRAVICDNKLSSIDCKAGPSDIRYVNGLHIKQGCPPPLWTDGCSCQSQSTSVQFGFTCQHMLWWC